MGFTHKSCTLPFGEFQNLHFDFAFFIFIPYLYIAQGTLPPFYVLTIILWRQCFLEAKGSNIFRIGSCHFISAADTSLIMFWLQGNLTLSDIGLAEKRIYHAALNGNNSLPSVLHQKDD